MQHVGSTSISELPAKPIFDFVIGVEGIVYLRLCQSKTVLISKIRIRRRHLGTHSRPK
ncbi:MAG: hypothetical protein CMN78_05945 [Spirochaetales bacterium]|nr:hypothetical protein [Spirochaetales bacterium]